MLRSKFYKAIVRDTIQRTIKELGKEANIHQIHEVSNSKLPKTLKMTTGSFYQYLRIVER